MVKRCLPAKLASRKRLKWIHGSGGMWNYCEEEKVYTKVWYTEYYDTWFDPESGWPYPVIWYLSEYWWDGDFFVEKWRWKYP